jgi:hypothetical protein
VQADEVIVVSDDDDDDDARAPAPMLTVHDPPVTPCFAVGVDPGTRHLQVALVEFVPGAEVTRVSNARMQVVELADGARAVRDPGSGMLAALRGQRKFDLLQWLNRTQPLRGAVHGHNVTKEQVDVALREHVLRDEAVCGWLRACVGVYVENQTHARHDVHSFLEYTLLAEARARGAPAARMVYSNAVRARFADTVFYKLNAAAAAAHQRYDAKKACARTLAQLLLLGDAARTMVTAPPPAGDKLDDLGDAVLCALAGGADEVMTAAQRSALA